MKKTPLLMGIACLAILASCKKDSAPETNSTIISEEEKALVAGAGFNSNWFEKTTDGKYLIEGDISLSREQLQELNGAKPTNNLIVANEEHYRTYNLVKVTAGSVRHISVRLTDGFPAHYSTGLDQALSRYNSLNLGIYFDRVSTGGEIVITAANLGTSGGGCILGQSSGFPDANGNPASGFTLSNSSCATTYINTANKADEVMAHELGHTIGFRHTDYKRRNSCGPGGGETAGSIGAVHIDGTPTNVSGSYNSWMMACTNGDPIFNSDDAIALRTVYPN